MKNIITTGLFILTGSIVSFAQMKTTVVSQKKISQPKNIEEPEQQAEPIDSVQVVHSTSRQNPIERIIPVSPETKQPESVPQKTVPATTSRKPE